VSFFVTLFCSLSRGDTYLRASDTILLSSVTNLNSIESFDESPEMSSSKSGKSGKSLLQRIAIKSHQRVSLPAVHQIWGIVLSKIGGKARLNLSKFSVHRSDTSQASDSCDDSDASTTWEGWTSQFSHTPASSIESIPKWDPLDIPPPLEEYIVLPTVSFATPLPPPKSLNGNWLDIDVQRHQFLLSFLHQERYMDIPFGTAHRMINYVMHLSEEAAFDFVKLHQPESMYIELEDGEFKWAKSADDVEIHFWVRHIIKHSWDLQKHMTGGGIYNDLSQLRLHAVHSWVYDTHQIKTAVAFLAMLRDEPRITALEQVLRVVYLTHQEARQPIITDAERHIVDVALGYIPTEPGTVHQVLCRAQELLESACYNYWAKHSPQRLAEFQWPRNAQASTWVIRHGWDCPERVELNFWNEVYWNFEAFKSGEELSDPAEDDFKYLKRLLNSATCLRHAAAHRRVQIGKYTLAEMLEEAQWLAEALDDEVATEEIRDELRKNECWDYIREEQAEATAESMALRKECAEEERVKWQQRVVAQILEDSLLLRQGLLTCETTVGECVSE